MADAIYLHLQGPGAEAALLRLNDFFQSHAGLMLQALPDAPPDETVRGLRDQGKKLYAFVKEGRDWIAAGVTVAAIFLAPSAAPAPQPAPFIEKVNATRELIQVVNDLRGELTFSIELVDANTGAVLRIDNRTAPAQVIEFCQQAQEAAP